MKSSMKKLFSLTAFIIITAFINPAGAQCNMKNMNHSSSNENDGAIKHHTGSANNGEIIKTGNYQFEIVYEPVLVKDPFTIYVMNKRGKPLAFAEITGKVDITYQDGSTETVSLYSKGENAYSIPLKKTSLSFVCLFNIQIDNKNVLLRFEYKGTDTTPINATDTYYTCPMHPEIKSDKPGNCPKCGMALEPKARQIN